MEWQILGPTIFHYDRISRTEDFQLLGQIWKQNIFSVLFYFRENEKYCSSRISSEISWIKRRIPIFETV